MTKSVIVLRKNVSLMEAVNRLDSTGTGAIGVVNESGGFIGLITDSDVRKALIEQKFSLENIINRKPKTLHVSSTIPERRLFLKKIKRRHLPIIDSQKKLIEIYSLDELSFKTFNNPIVIMAGGLGSRLGKLTKSTPKPMLKIGKTPILHLIIKSFLDQNFFKFLISVNYKKEKIMEYFKDGSNWGAEISYIEESERLGTGGALSLIKQDFQEPIIVMNGDIVCNINFEKLLDYHAKEKASATMCVRHYQHKIPFGVLEIEDKAILNIKEKPTIDFNINAGIYVIDPKIIKMIPRNTFFDLPTLFEKLKESNKKICAYHIDDYWIDIGNFDQYEKAQLLMNN